MNAGDAEPVESGRRLAPAPDVLAAIELAVEQCWPGAAGGVDRPGCPRPGWAGGARHPWRFSARWWSPHPLDHGPERPGWSRGG